MANSQRSCPCGPLYSLAGEQPPLELLPPLELPPTPTTYSAAVASAAAVHLPPHNVALLPPLAIGQPEDEVPFADEKLGRQAEAWRRKQQVLAEQTAALQAAPGQPSQPQQLALILLQVGVVWWMARVVGWMACAGAEPLQGVGVPGLPHSWTVR